MNYITAMFGDGEQYDIGIVKTRQEMIDRIKKWDMRVFGYDKTTNKPIKRSVYASGRTVSGEYVQVFVDSADQVFTDPPMCDDPLEDNCVRKEYRCVGCGENSVNPFDGEDTCSECISKI
jgi:hypothetical protein